ncbi:MAG: hypothetical protein QOG16_331 [Actinomycetota bacterium]|jgi:hypothetical protein|nr:hypothetical protein [Actinomycetota bacterium]
MTSPIEQYLIELEARLPMAGRRIVTEARDHLLEERDRLMANEVERMEAERQAVASYGHIEDIVSAVRANGGPVLSPRVIKWIPWVALLLSLPTLVFIAVNVIEEVAGNSGGVGVFGDSLDHSPLAGLIDRMLVFGPLLAFGLVVLATTNVRFTRQERGFNATIHLRLTGRLLVIGIVSGLVAGAVVAYWLAENMLCAGFPPCGL